MVRSSGNGNDGKRKNISETTENFEERFRRQTEELRRQRREYYRSKGERRRGVNAADDGSIYKARAALNIEIAKKRKKRGEGAIKRTIRLLLSLRRAARKYRDHTVYPPEKRWKAYGEIFKDCWAPVYHAGSRMIDTAWSFVCIFARDFWDFVLYVADLGITAWYYLGSALLFLWDILWDIRYWLEMRKRILFQTFAAVVSVAAVIAVAVSSMTFYEYYYHGRLLGVVRSKNDVYKTITVLGDKLSEAAGANVSLDIERDMEFRIVRGTDYEADSKEDILNTLTYMRSIEVAAYAINVDGVQRVIIESEDAARKILTGIQNDYTPARPGVKYTSVSFTQEIAINEVTTQLGKIWNFADAKRYLKTGSISKEADLEAVPFVTVAVTATETFMEGVEFGTKYVNNASMYMDEKEVISAGILGINEVSAMITTINGIEIERKIMSAKQISAPVDEVIYKGTKPIPPSEGTGTFIYPINNYTLSSRFGIRWGRMHYGVDFAAPHGTKIYAADGGTVVFTGWSRPRGYYLIIDHGGLFKTLYEHCSKILVETGDKVYQGKNIALVGNTGYSTGPHLHFEVHYKDVPVNPLNYL